MSKTIDEKVVSIQFDNQRFEKNVSETMSTLDKLKQKLNFNGASKGLENVNAAAGKVNMTGLGNAVETVHAKFSALEVMGVTALANITNSAVNAGKRIVSALTIDPIKTGFQEYETQMNAVQTILANTSSKGSTLDDVNNALEQLNKYADQTIYNFTEMTRNIGTFTAAGVDLDTSVASIKGIANLAAVSGSTSQQASTAMYQLSQALAAGKVSLMDWNSVVNAGMGGEVFQNALKRTSEVMGTGAEAAIAEYGSFRESLTKGEWLTTDVLTETLNQFTMAAEEGTKQWEEYKSSLKEKGYTEEQAIEILKMANTATDAATKVKTFTQLWDVMKEAAQSGWAQTWKIIVGDFEEAKALLTPLADFFTNVINKMSESRNALLESALGKGFAELSKKIKTIVKPIETTSEAIGAVVDSVKDYAAVVDEIIRGNWGNGKERYDRLTEAGYDWAHAQNLVNEKLGDSTRHATDYKEAQDEVVKSQEKLEESTVKRIAELAAEDEATLKSLGYTDKQIEAFKELKDTADKLGLSVEDLITNVDEIDGRWLLINSFKNVGQSIVTIFKSIGEAWRNAFSPMSADTLFNIIAGIHKFSTYLVITEGTADKLTRTLKGVFAILDIVATLTGSVFKIGFQIIQEFLKALGYIDVDILGVTATIGDAIVAFRDWLEEHNLISKVISKVVPFLVKMGQAVVDLVKQLWELPIVQEAVGKVVSAFTTLESKIGGTISDTIEWLGKLDNITLDDITKALKSIGEAIGSFFSGIDNKYFNGIGGDILSGLANGLKNGAIVVWDTITNIATTLINKFVTILGIASPSKVFFAIGGFIIAGLIGGLLGGKTDIGSTISDIVNVIIEKFSNITETIKTATSNIDWSTIFASGMSVGLLIVLKNLTDFLKNISSVSGGIGDVLENVSDFVSSFSESLQKNMKAKAFKTRTEGIRNLAISILILAGAIALLTQLDIGKMWNAVGVITALSVIMFGLSFALAKLSDAFSSEISKDSIQINGLKTALITIGIAILLMAATVKLIGDMNPEKAKQGFLGLIGVVTTMALLFAAYGTFVKGESAQNIDKAGKMMRKIATTMLLMVGVIKLISFLKEDELKKGAICMGAFVVFVAAISLVSRIASGDIDKVGKTMSKIAIAMGLMVGVIKLISFLTVGELIKGAICMGAFVLFVKALVSVTTVGKDSEIAKVGGTLLAISAAMLLMIGVIKIISGMEVGALVKGIVGVTLLTGVMYLLIKMVKSAGSDAPKIAGTLLAMSLAIGILAAVAIVLSLISIEGLAKGIIAVGMISSMMVLMIRATKDAQDVQGSLIGMAVAIGVIAAAIVVLSFIDPKKLIGPTIAIGLLMGMFTLMESQAKNVTGSMACLIVMTVAIGMMAAALYILSGLPIEQSIGSAIALSILMTALSASLFIISKANTTMKDALVGMVGLLALCVPMAAFVGILAWMQNIENAATNAMALASLMGILTLLLIPLSIIGAIITSGVGTAFIVAGIASLVGMIVPMAAFVGILAWMQNIENAATNAKLLTDLLTVLTDTLVLLASIGPLALIGVTAMAGLTGLMIGIGAMAIAVGALMQEFPALESFIDTGIPILVKLATGIGEIISGFMTGLTSGLPEIGTQLTDFMKKAEGFISGAKLVDESVLAGVVILTSAILALTAADLIEGIVSMLNFGTSFSTLGTELSTFMTEAEDFITGISKIDPSIMEGVKSLTSAILILTGANVIEGIASLIPGVGGSSLADFGSQLGQLGTNLKTFVGNLGTFTDAQVTTVTCACDAIKALASAANSLPNEGGKWAELFGDNSLAAFGSQLGQLGTNLKDFVGNLGTFTEAQVTTVTCAGNAIKALAEAADTIPNDGGLWGALVGENSLATFGSYLPGLGDNLSSFVGNLGTFTEAQVTTVGCACDAIKALASAADIIPNDGGLWGAIVGENSLATFGSQLGGLGDNLKVFVTNLGTFSEAQVATVRSACNAIRAIASLGNENLEIGNISDFGKKIETLATKIKSFVSKVGEVGTESITSAIIKTRELISMAKSVASVNISSLDTFGTSLEKVAKDGVNGFVEEFSGETPKSKAQKATKAMLDSAIKGAEDKKEDVKNKFKTISEAAVDSMSSTTLTSDAKQAGKDLVTGFANGISAQKWEAEAKAKAMAQAALKAAKEALDEHSPSREFYKVGAFAGQGLTNALGDYETKSYKAGYGMAEYAKNGLSKAISKVNDLFNNDIDTQPTIRPVLDLSDVTAGACSINGLFNTQSIGVTSNLRAINSMMSENQNGGNNDIVSAINKLRKDLGNVGGTTYNVNGVTYDDGSNISNAVRDLVRAARVERRI